jgi:2-keto-4-pentenoate hydratase/2-oxohepta-3-ene-1,7-dioic acid hydratase in catechol pathway
MRIGNVAGRLVLANGANGANGDRILDVEAASGGRFSADVQAVYERWAEFRQWAADLPPAAETPAAETPAPEALEAPAPRPRQVFAIGLNYRDHAAEAGLELPTTSLVVFTKFPASITGPFATIDLPSGSVDYEAELVVVLGRTAYQVPAEHAWDYVAGLTMGQDLSEREVQFTPPTPQFSLGKSFPGFAPMGPWLVTPDEFADPDDLELGCLLNGEQLQKSRTSEMVFPVARIISFLSAILPLYPGDVIFTGTPAGIGWVRNPRRLLRAGDELVTFAEQIGSMRNHFAGPRSIGDRSDG